MTFKVDIKGFLISATAVKSLEAQIAEILEKQLEFANTEIKTRTRLGKDADEKEFVPYSDEYAQYRRDNSRPDQPVDLIWSGRMTRAQRTKISRKGTKGEIYFNSAKEAEKAAALMKGRKRKSDGVQNARNFFAFGENLTNKIVENFKEWINLKKANK